MLDVRRLRVLSAVAARGSFSAAAEALTLTQSAVSQHVAALEREVGLPLVERGTRPVELTEAGHALVRHATGIFARLDGAEQELGEIAGRRRVLPRLEARELDLALIYDHEARPEVGARDPERPALTDDISRIGPTPR